MDSQKNMVLEFHEVDTHKHTLTPQRKKKAKQNTKHKKAHEIKTEHITNTRCRWWHESKSRRRYKGTRQAGGRTLIERRWKMNFFFPSSSSRVIAVIAGKT